MFNSYEMELYSVLLIPITNCCTYIPCTVMDSFTKLHPVYLYCTTVTCTRCSWRLELTYITYMYVITLL